MHVRDYAPSDREHCLAIFDSNVPGSFTAAERPEYEAFLDALPGPYFLLEDGDHVIACGGYAVTPGTSCADLCWGMVAREYQGRGVGRLLTEIRIERIRTDLSITEAALRTSQHTRAFYERLGFVTERTIENGIAPGLHRCEMRMQLNRRK